MKKFYLSLILLTIVLISGCSTSTLTETKTNPTVSQNENSVDLKFDLNLSELAYNLPPHTKICLPKTRNDCLSGECVKKRPVVFVLYDEATKQVYRCDNNPCDGFEVKVDESGLYTNLTPIQPNGSMYKFSYNNYVETVSLGLDLIIYEGLCNDVK